MNLPVAVRELRVRAAGRRTYRLRVYLSLIAIVSTIWTLYNLLQFSGHPSNQIGQELFAMQVWSAFVLAAIAGVSATADSISHEKRAGTLGLLFLTHLKGRDIVIGKLAVHTIGCFSGVLALLPILSLSLLLGGVQFSECARALIVILETMFFTAAIGLLVSSFCRTQQRAQGLGILIVLFFTGGLTGTVQFLRYYGASPDLCLALELPNPVFAQTLAFGSLAGSQKTYFALSCAVIFGLGLVCLGAASLLTPRCWQDKAGQSPAENLLMRFAVWKTGHIQTRSRMGGMLLDRNPFLWLVSFRTGVRTSVWLYIMLVTGIAAFLILDFSRHNDPAAVRIGVCLPVAYLLNIGLKVRIGGWASYRLAEARENGALELILSTPLRIPDLVTGHFLGFRRVFGWPTLTVMSLLVLSYILSLPGFDRLGSLFNSDPEASIYRVRALLLLGCSMGFLVLDALALTWCGMWFGLKSKNPGQARSFTMILCLVGPLLLYPFLLPILDQVKVLKPYFKQPDFYIVTAFLAGVAGLADLGIIYWARRQILSHGRELAKIAGSDFDRCFPNSLRNIKNGAVALMGRLSRRRQV
jgi:ABC-type transport system involved in multi-copper enzyme maturation permease subunit